MLPLLFFLFVTFCPLSGALRCRLAKKHLLALHITDVFTLSLWLQSVVKVWLTASLGVFCGHLGSLGLSPEVSNQSKNMNIKAVPWSNKATPENGRLPLLTQLATELGDRRCVSKRVKTD